MVDLSGLSQIVTAPGARCSEGRWVNRVCQNPVAAIEIQADNLRAPKALYYQCRLPDGRELAVSRTGALRLELPQGLPQCRPRILGPHQPAALQSRDQPFANLVDVAAADALERRA